MLHVCIGRRRHASQGGTWLGGHAHGGVREPRAVSGLRGAEGGVRTCLLGGRLVEGQGGVEVCNMSYEQGLSTAGFSA